MGNKDILDATAGSKMMWFDKQNERTVYIDEREGVFQAYGKTTIVQPCIKCDFRNMPFEDNSFNLVVFDPPHSKWLKPGTIFGNMYGCLTDDWKDTIKRGLEECMRVLKPKGTLIFKWNDKDIKTKEVLALVNFKPLFGHPTGNKNRTIWITFMKD